MPISVNYSYGMNCIGVAMHQAQGNGSLYHWFNNPNAQVSAHFWVPKSRGTQIEQYVDTANVAWCHTNMNSTYLGVECEGFAEEPLTDWQEECFGEIMAEAKRVHGVPLVEANYMGQSGLAYHRLPGSANSTACPSDLRLASRPRILELAGGAAPGPPPQEQEGDDDPMVIATNKAGGQWLIWGSFRTAIANPQESEKYKKAGAKHVDWDEEMIQKFPIAQNAVK
jgi:hypothetical protein